MKIFKPNVTNIDKSAVTQIYDMLSQSKDNVALDLGNVKSCVNEFFEMLSKLAKVSLVNVDSSILATLYMTGYDRFVRVFEDTLSLEADKYEIINRRFKTV